MSMTPSHLLIPDKIPLHVARILPRRYPRQSVLNRRRDACRYVVLRLWPLLGSIQGLEIIFG